MIIDIHTHVFPPHIRERRDEYLRRDAAFRELYQNPRAAIATADDVLREMERSGVDRAVILNFAWTDPALCRETNDYILEAAASSQGRLIPFVMINPTDADARDELIRCVRLGARGVGELRPASQGYVLGTEKESQLLSWAAAAFDLPLLFHTSEPVGHPYPGKSGLPLHQLYQFIQSFPGITVIAAHWGGGLPFYSLMPEVRDVLADTYFDTAATRFLYSRAIYAEVTRILGSNRVLLGSDFPLVSQRAALADVRDAGLDPESLAAVLGDNAATILRLSDAA